MAFPDFLNKKKKDKKGKAFDPQAVMDKCQKVLDQIKGLNEERYTKLYRSFRSQFDKSANIQKKKIHGFYAQLVDELKSLQGNAQDRLYATGQEFIKKAEQTAKNNPTAKKAVKEVSKVVDELTKTTKKKAKKVAKKATKVAKKTAKKATTTKKKAVAKKVTKKTTAAKKKTAKKKTSK